MCAPWALGGYSTARLAFLGAFMVPASDHPMALGSMTGVAESWVSSLAGAGEPGNRVPSCMPQLCFRLMVVSCTNLIAGIFGCTHLHPGAVNDGSGFGASSALSISSLVYRIGSTTPFAF